MEDFCQYMDFLDLLEGAGVRINSLSMQKYSINGCGIYDTVIVNFKEKTVRSRSYVYGFAGPHDFLDSLIHVVLTHWRISANSAVDPACIQESWQSVIALSISMEQGNTNVRSRTNAKTFGNTGRSRY